MGEKGSGDRQVWAGGRRKIAGKTEKSRGTEFTHHVPQEKRTTGRRLCAYGQEQRGAGIGPSSAQENARQKKAVTELSKNRREKRG